ncbi:hydrolase [Nocardioides szechwanensis]|uniref:GDSL-like Lipase/Acylhydrolase family protein n=1 Tax=Nocardioides szechwanensis TaxID=1005944 RepID=A0A1H0A9Z7_9ACTN|nr:SGNH/GDSL hydrolase family protein [Nocardioides szechwanensis]GEP34920.1 hydrolase [Nocardioides szechwanensis]SDN30267.1 GDSL-like Lipase/Acylhydrolase family protein [Nocardioides szechwanensis]
MTRPHGGRRYVALGSSMAAGPGITPRASGSPRAAMRSASNYPHLLAADLTLDLVDVSHSGATTANVLTDPQLGTPPQVEALDGTEDLVTITIGGNDIGYVPGLFVATLPGVVRALPVIGARLRDALDRDAREEALVRVADSLRAVGTTLRRRSPHARILFVEYLTLMPPPGEPAWPLKAKHVDLARHLADRLVEITSEAAAETGCEVVPVAEASREHHAWSGAPWTVGAALPLPGRPLAYHPNAAGMRAVATKIRQHLAG